MLVRMPRSGWSGGYAVREASSIAAQKQTADLRARTFMRTRKQVLCSAPSRYLPISETRSLHR
jgi:hypothetical protein